MAWKNSLLSQFILIATILILYYSKFDKDHLFNACQHSSGERIFKILVHSCLAIIKLLLRAS